ncbi:MAG: Crp/Fnr family transcriptional regulator [Janthinobacterium lividum]
MLDAKSHMQINQLLNSMSVDDRETLSPHFELIPLKRGQLLADAGETMSYVYFPTSAVASMLESMRNGSVIETASIGSEGVIGIPVLTGGSTMPSRIEVRTAGFCYRIPAADFKEAFERLESVRRVMLLYIQALMTQIAQCALGNRHHSLSDQLCRWLLIEHDRVAGDELRVTQQTIAKLLGVRREGVTEAAGRLQKAGFIRQGRGHIEIRDREALEERAGECYSVARREFERLLRPRTDAFCMQRGWRPGVSERWRAYPQDV